MDRTRYDTPEERVAGDFPGGVLVKPMPVTAGETVTISYDGLLSQSGAEQVYLHCGYGPFGAWSDVEDLPMEKTGRGWEKHVEMKNNSRLNVCFRDNAWNWDNNDGINWSFEIHDGLQI